MKINVYYAKLNNMGDLLNEYIIPAVTGFEVNHYPNAVNFDVMGIGSCNAAIWGNTDDSLKMRIKDNIKYVSDRLIRKPGAVWGTGFFKDYSDRKLVLLRQNISFIALRGELSKRIVENSLGKSIDPVLCDGGILSSCLVSKVEKKYEVGFIPHYREQELFVSKGIKDRFEGKYTKSTIINLRDDPVNVIRQISQCEYILSSSLHGCVVADSFNIPNLRIRLSDIPGTGFKFDDYYSSYGITVQEYDLSNSLEIPSVNVIIDRYLINAIQVEQKKNAMIECLNNFLKSFE